MDTRGKVNRYTNVPKGFILLTRAGEDYYLAVDSILSYLEFPRQEGRNYVNRTKIELKYGGDENYILVEDTIEKLNQMIDANNHLI